MEPSRTPLLYIWANSPGEKRCWNCSPSLLHSRIRVGKMSASTFPWSITPGWHTVQRWYRRFLPVRGALNPPPTNSSLAAGWRLRSVLRSDSEAAAVAAADPLLLLLLVLLLLLRSVTHKFLLPRVLPPPVAGRWAWRHSRWASMAGNRQVGLRQAKGKTFQSNQQGNFTALWDFERVWVF